MEKLNCFQRGPRHLKLCFVFKLCFQILFQIYSLYEILTQHHQKPFCYQDLIPCKRRRISGCSLKTTAEIHSHLQPLINSIIEGLFLSINSSSSNINNKLQQHCSRWLYKCSSKYHDNFGCFNVLKGNLLQLRPFTTQGLFPRVQATQQHYTDQS